LRRRWGRQVLARAEEQDLRALAEQIATEAHELREGVPVVPVDGRSDEHEVRDGAGVAHDDLGHHLSSHGVPEEDHGAPSEVPQVRGDEVAGAFDRGRTRRFRGLAVAGQVDRDDERVLLGAQRQIGEHLAAHPDPVDEDEGADAEASPRRSAITLAPSWVNDSISPSSVGTPVASSIARSTASAAASTVSSIFGCCRRDAARVQSVGSHASTLPNGIGRMNLFSLTGFRPRLGPQCLGGSRRSPNMATSGVERGTCHHARLVRCLMRRSPVPEATRVGRSPASTTWRAPPESRT
jgi:hypothetical protein